MAVVFVTIMTLFLQVEDLKTEKQNLEDDMVRIYTYACVMTKFLVENRGEMHRILESDNSIHAAHDLINDKRFT